MLITVTEVIHMIIMVAAIGFIFKDMFRIEKVLPNNLHHLKPANIAPGFNWDGFKFVLITIAPALILHELAHKFVAMSYGFDATFKAHFLFLGLGLLLKLLNFGFIFLVPGFVQIIGAIPPAQHAIIAFAGPAIHLIFWLGSWALLKSGRKFSVTVNKVLAVTKQVNMFLFILNMLPIPGIDGMQVYSSLFAMF